MLANDIQASLRDIEEALCPNYTFHVRNGGDDFVCCHTRPWLIVITKQETCRLNADCTTHTPTLPVRGLTRLTTLPHAPYCTVLIERKPIHLSSSFNLAKRQMFCVTLSIILSQSF